MFSGSAIIIVAISCCATSHIGPKKVADMVVSQVRQCFFKVSNANILLYLGKSSKTRKSSSFSRRRK